jgi:hypothetical protein
MASRAEGLYTEAEAEEEAPVGEVAYLPERRKPRAGEKAVCCLGQNKDGQRCGRARNAIFCDEHAPVWEDLPSRLQDSLAALAVGEHALSSELWDTQFSVVSALRSRLRGAETYTDAVEAAEAAAEALGGAQQQLDEALESGATRLAGKNRVAGLLPLAV